MQLRSSTALFLSIILSTVISGVLHAQSKADCLQCHSDKSLTTERNGKTISLFADEGKLNSSPHAKLVCVACHSGFDPNNMPHKEKIEPVNCMTCHRDAPVWHRFHPQMATPQVAKANGRNGSKDISCKNCHGTHDVVSPKVPGSKFFAANLVAACTACHTDKKETFLKSAHGEAFGAGVKGAPTCFGCHKNDITKAREGRDSVQIKIAQEQVCLSCHLDNPDVRAQMSPDVGFIRAYDQSVHGKALRAGNAKVANCVNCHGSHGMAKGADPRSSMNRMNVPQTCARCHPAIAKQYADGIHGEALRQGKPEAPVCTNCHGEHNIMKAADPHSPVAAANVSQQVCSPCHSSMKLSQKYGIRADRFQTFQDSYHGLAMKGGAVEVANCASCHGAHYIRPSSDSTSTINAKNLANTCGQCHKGANKRFVSGTVHVKKTSTEEPLLYWVATIYIALIAGTIGGMFIHNLADFIRKSKRKLAIRRGALHETHAGPHLYLRMTKSERLQHGLLLVSFLMLVITGFMLRFPEAWWVRAIRDLIAAAYDWRGVVHRVAAVAMLAASAFHLYYIIFTERGKQLVKDLWFKISDLTDMAAVLKYNFGFSNEKPKFGRFSYIEKSEYWALVWGMIVMGATGFIMWFDNT
ncbi:MAG: cytochrome b/b6 domain-containing protein, partial [Ignavibacteriales bacterium]|nr:cytochrome b/b6 domain-containing protein [Ignavibacteriales bacterium]